MADAISNERICLSSERASVKRGPDGDKVGFGRRR